jgi:hypothetical protein
VFSKFSTALKEIGRVSKRSEPEENAHSFSEKQISPRPHYSSGRTIAISIDSHFLSLSACSTFAGRNRVLALRKLPVPQDPAEKDSFIKNAIADFHGTYGKRSAEVILSVSGSETTYRTFTLPTLAKRDLNDAVRYEAARQIPFAIEDAIYDFRILSKISLDGGQRYKVALQAATRRHIEQQLAIFTSLGITVSTIHFSHDAIGQLLRSLPEYKESNEYTLIRLNQSQLEIAFYRGTSLEMLHHASLDDMFFPGWAEYVDSDSVSASIAQEVVTAMDFYSGQFSRSGSSKVYAYGDLSGSDQLVEQLELKTGLDIRRFPTGKLTFLKGQDPFFSNTMRESLAVIASCFCSYQLASMLPPEQKAVIRVRKLNRLSALGFAALLGALALFWVNQRNELASIKTRLETLQNQLAEAKTSTANASFDLLQSQIASNKTYFDQIEASSGGASLNLKSISHITPDGVQLTSFEFEPGKTPENLYVQGIVRSAGMPPELILADYVKAFGKNRYFENVRLMQYAKKKTDDGFDLQFSIGMEGIQ